MPEMLTMPRVLLAAATAATTLLAGCGSMYEHHRSMHGGPSAKVQLQPTRGNTTAGSVHFHQQGANVMVHARITGLKPEQEHGFHVHQNGDCSSGDGMSAGGHFNPLNKPHGHHSTSERHAGDMPNLKADANGRAEARFTMAGISIGSGATDIIGKSVIVHVDPDDYRSQPTGNAGARMACGVVAKR
jgi:superoxide dismutase, Cu-Zn family